MRRVVGGPAHPRVNLLEIPGVQGDGGERDISLHIETDINETTGQDQGCYDPPAGRRQALLPPRPAQQRVH